MSAVSPDVVEATSNAPAPNALEENRRLRRTMRDLIALSTLPAIWGALHREGIARSLCDTLQHTLALDLVYVRFAGHVGKDLIEAARSMHRETASDAVVKSLLAAVLRRHQEKSVTTIADPFGSDHLYTAVVRFGIGGDEGALVVCSPRADFPTELERLLLSISANQTAIVMHRRQIEEQVLEQREWLRVTLASIGDAVVATDTEGRITFINSAAEKLTGWTPTDVQGQPLTAVCPIVIEGRRATTHIHAAHDGRHVAPYDPLVIAKDGAEIPVDISTAPIQHSTGHTIGTVNIFRPVIEQRRMEQHRNARLAVTQTLSSAETISDPMQNVLRELCDNLGWELGIFWVANAATDSLVRHAYWHRDDSSLAQFASGSCSRSFVRGEGLPGRVWESGRTLWIPLESNDGTFPRFPKGNASGLQSAIGCPMTVGNRTLGVMEFFTRSRLEPDTNLLETMNSIAGTVAHFIERTKAEEQLRRSEEELADFFENATVGLHWVGPDGTILRTNRAELEMLGYSRDDYLGHSITEFHVDPEVIGDILHRLTRGEQLKDYPARLRCKDGSIKDVLIDSSVLWNKGEFIHTRCFTRDITEHKRAELELADARARLDAALEAGAVATWTWDIPSNRLYADTRLTELFNLPASESEGGLLDRYLQSIHPEDLDKTLAAINHAVATAQPYSADYRIVQADGSVRWANARGLVEHDGAGRPIRMPGVLVDITERKRLEEELQLSLTQLAEADRYREALLSSLRESEQKFRLLADAIPQLAWMAHPTGEIFWYNQRWYDYTGTTLEQMEGWGWQSVHDPEVLPEVLARWTKSIAVGEPFEMVFPLKGADGKFRPFLTRVNPLHDEQGSILYWFGTNTDISKLKEMEASLRDADRRKDEFLATLAHELRNPLAPIRNSLEILKMPRLDAGVIKQTRAMMERQVQHLVRLVDDLLDVSRVMRGKIELRKEPVELATVVARAVETVQPLIEVQGHQLELSLPQESLLLYADPMRLVQVVGNLLTNSAKYTESRGRIWVFAERESKEVVLHVRDSGIGIAPELLPYVFDLFVQADYASTKAQGGLGIGLTLAKNLVQMHDGTIEARSDGLGAGCEFIVRLPLLKEAQKEVADESVKSDSALPSPSGRRLLVVDDNRDAANSLATLLRLQGHEVRVAHDGSTALAIVDSYRPAVVFLDLGMPGMDGCEVARRVRGTHANKSVVLAALTGWGQQADRSRTAKAGFDFHLVKPVDGAAIDRVLGVHCKEDHCDS